MHHEPLLPWRGQPWARTLGLGVAGAITGFLAHEAGHLAANLLLGNVPSIRGTRTFGWLPFFVISPGIACDGDRCTERDGDSFGPGRGGLFFIVTAGFHAQHATNEVLLSSDPELRYRYAPFRKGVLLFNVVLSCIYASGEFTGLEDPHGDLAGAARIAGLREPWLASLLLLPVALDVYRFFYPDVRWSPWISRASKAALIGVNIAF